MVLPPLLGEVNLPIIESPERVVINPEFLSLHNHMNNNIIVGDKMKLYAYLKKHCKSIGILVESMVPETYIVDSIICKDFTEFTKRYDEIAVATRLREQRKEVEETVGDSWEHNI